MTKPGEATQEPPLRGLRRLFLFGGAAGLAISSVLAAGLRVVGHDDLWWDLAAGRYILAHGEIPTTDVLSFTFAGRPWVNLEWLSQVLFFGVYEGLGEDAVVMLRLGMLVLIFSLTFHLCRLQSRSTLASLLAVAFGAWVCQPFLDARPQLFTFLDSILLLWILHLYRRRRRDLLWVVPILLLVWTQLHNGYLFGLLLLFGNLLAEAGKRLLHLPADPLTWREWRKLGWVTLASAAAILVNPWTVEAYTHPLTMSKLLGSSNLYLTVAEWQPPKFFTEQFFNPIQFWWFLLLTTLVVLPIAAVRWRSFDLNDVGLAVVLAGGFALQHRRFIPLFTLLTLPLLSWALKFWLDWWFHGRRDPAWQPGEALPAPARARMRHGALAAAGASWLLLALLLPRQILAWRATYADDSLFRTNIHAAFYPEGAVDFARRAELPGRVFNLYNWGGYLEFFLPEYPAFIDGRAQMVFSDGFYREYLAAHYAEAGWKKVLERHGVTWALLHRERNAALLRAMDDDPGWRWIFADGESAVLVADVEANRDLLARWRSGGFPLSETAMSAYLLGRDALAAGELEQAVEKLGRAAELAPEEEDIRAQWIIALAAAGRLEAARREAGFALKEFPESAGLHLAAAEAERRGGRPEEAFAIYREVFERWPGEEQAIAGMLAVDPEQGRRAVEAAYREEPFAPWRSWALGRVMEQAGETERARKLYQAEGAAAARAGDGERLLEAKRAFDRLEESGPPPEAGGAEEP